MILNKLPARALPSHLSSLDKGYELAAMLAKSSLFEAK